MATLKRVDHFGGDREPETVQDASAVLHGIEQAAAARKLRVVVEDDGSLRLGPFALTRVGLVAAPHSREDWLQLGDLLFALEGSLQWQVGDFLLLGERAWGVTTRAVAEALGREAHTLYNWVGVARAFEMSRRRDILSFGHHEAVVALTPRGQELWLEQAAANAWSVAALRAAIRESRREPAPGMVQAFEKRFGALWKSVARADAGTRREIAAMLRRKADEIEKGR